MKHVVVLSAAIACSGVLATGPEQRTLTFEERVKAQEAIERVYHAHPLSTTTPFDDLELRWRRQ